MKIKLIIFKLTVKAQYKNRLAYCGKVIIIVHSIKVELIITVTSVKIK